MTSSRSTLYLTDRTVQVLLHLKHLPYVAVGAAQVARAADLPYSSAQGTLNRLVQADWAERVDWIRESPIPEPRPSALFRLNRWSPEQQVGHVRYPYLMELMAREFPAHPVVAAFPRKVLDRPQSTSTARVLEVFLEHHPAPVWAGDIAVGLGVKLSATSVVLRQLVHQGWAVLVGRDDWEGSPVLSRRYHRLTPAGLVEAGQQVLSQVPHPSVRRLSSVDQLNRLQAMVLAELVGQEEPGLQEQLAWDLDTPLAEMVSALYGLWTQGLVMLEVDPQDGSGLLVLTEVGRTFTVEHVETAPLSSFRRN